jgi:hypothetical protein
MSLKAGDKVRFLDEKGEGVISRFLDNRQVLVLMEDGFEIPYPVNKLVPVMQDTRKSDAKAEPLVYKKDVIEQPHFDTPQQGLQEEGVFLVYLPADPDQPLAGNFTVHVFNHTDYHIQFAVSTKLIGKYKTEYVDTLAPHQSVKIRDIQAEDIERWSSLLADILFFSYDNFVSREPVSRVLKQKPARFYKETSFTEKGFTASPSIVVDLTRSMHKSQAWEEEYFEEKELLKIVFEKEHKPVKPLSRQSEKNNSALEWEVDLHLEELVDNVKGMTNGQMLDIQLRHFQKKLDEAMASNIRKVVFIHGVGNGRLKQEIRKLLGTYKELRFHDAAYGTYGFGATEVVFR